MDYFFAIRLFGLLIVSLYIYKKILDIKDVSKLKIKIAIIFSLLMSVLMSFLQTPLMELLFVVSAFVFVVFAARVKTSLMISSVVISIGISLGIDNLAALIYSAIALPVELIYFTVTETPLFGSTNQETLTAIVQSILLIMLIVFINYLFKIKRLRNGILFWENKEAVRIGMIFSILIMLGMSMRGISPDLFNGESNIFIFHFFLAFLNGFYTFGLYLWWRHHTTALYRQQLREDIVQELQIKIDEKDKQIKNLSESNAFLSKTVHRDNKLIPSMYNAVDSFLSATENIDVKTKGAKLHRELEEILKERKDTILKFQREHKTLPSTGIERIDAIFNYMFSKAAEKNIEFDLVLTGDAKDIPESVISKQKLEILLADIIENAIIATSYCSYKRIQVTMGAVDGCYEINTQDSGISFEAETLANLGLKKTTTHAGTGGSGIGYLTIFEILKERGASLTITEYAPENYAFTKSVKICFDGKFAFNIYPGNGDNFNV